MRWNRAAVASVFYGGLALALASILLEALPHVLPQQLASSIAYNSEGYLLALVLGLWIQFARPRLLRSGWRWPVTVLVSLLCLACGVLLLASDLPSRFRTLNETFLAVSCLFIYVQASRPLPRRVAPVLAIAVLAVIVLANRTAAVTDLAETLGMLLLAPLALDVVDRGILDPEARTSLRLRLSWYGLLICLPICFSLLWHAGILTGLAYEITRYDIRMHEAFVGILLMELYFAVALGRIGQAQQSSPEGAPA